MAPPAPDPAAVMAVYERKTREHYTYDQIVEWARTQPWGPISRGTAFTWVKQGAVWWSAEQKLDPQAEYAMHRQTIDVLFGELHGAYRRGEIAVDVLTALSVKLLAEHRAATGFATVLAEPDGRAEVPPAAAAAIAEMEAERRRRELER